jgi:WD40 repeat protein
MAQLLARSRFHPILPFFVYPLDNLHFFLTCHKCRQIVSGSFDNTVRLWDAKTGQPLGKPFQGHQDWVTSVAFSPDGRQIVSGSRDKTVRLWGDISLEG